MDTLLPQFQPYKRKIPQFIIKLYHILQHQQFYEIICWVTDNNEILIKSPKKLQDKVLPHFFRHKHLSSFIRQLNMYGFSKANKLTKQKNHTYFRNQLFKKDQIQLLTKIKRKSHKKKQIQQGKDSAQMHDGPYDQSFESPDNFNSSSKNYMKQVNYALKEIQSEVGKILNLIVKNQTQIERRPRRRTRIEQQKIQIEGSFLKNPMETAQLKKKLNRVLDICNQTQKSNVCSLKNRQTSDQRQNIPRKLQQREQIQQENEESILLNGSIQQQNQNEQQNDQQAQNKILNLNACMFDSYGNVNHQVASKVIDNPFKSIRQLFPRLDSMPIFPSQYSVNQQFR